MAQDLIKNIFLCRTPYHILLASLFDCNNKMILGVDVNFIENINITNISKFSFFSLIKIFFLNKTKDRIFIFNDSNRLEYLVGVILKKKCEVNYIEDGEAAYNDHKLEYKKNLLFRFLDRIIGRKLNNRIGESNFFTNGYYMYPELVNNINVIGHHIMHFPFKENKSDIMRKLVENFEFNAELEFDTLLLCSKFKDRNDIIFTYTEKNISCNLALKIHPLNDNWFLEFDKYPNLNKSLPAELIPILYPQLKNVVGYRSTALYAIKKLFPEINVFLYTGKETDVTFYSNLDIEVLN